MSGVLSPETLAISVAGQCDRGKIRKDKGGTVRHTSTRLGDLLIIAKGVGSQAGGKRASQIAVDTVLSCIEKMPLLFPMEIAVTEAITQANAAIVEAAAGPEYRDSRMGATVVVALLRRDAAHAQAPVQAIVGRMGDSRAYLTHNQKLTLLTRDDPAGQDLLDEDRTPPEKGKAHPESPLPARYLGKQLNVRVEIRNLQLEAGDTLLLCSDELWRYVPEPEIERELSDGSRTVEETSRTLLHLALDAGCSDNVAIEIARVAQSADDAGGAIELRSEIQPEAASGCEVPPASDQSQPELPVAEVIVNSVESVEELPRSNRKGVFSLIRDLGRRKSDKESVTEKSVIPVPSAASDAEVQCVVSWAPPEPIVYGTPLSSVQLNAAASVEGKLIYTPGPGYILPAGTHTLWATFYAAGQGDTPALTEVSITVSKATPSLSWSPPAQMPPGVPLGTAQLNAFASVPGTFEYSPPLGEVLADGVHTLSLTFVPEDKGNYTTAQATVSVTVAKTVPKIEWASPDPIPCGTPLGASQLNASASIPGMFEYSPAAGEVLSAGSHTLSAIFIPSDDTSYSRAEATVSLSVTRATPTIEWPAPKEIPYGTLLSECQLNATASVPGTFVYTPGPGTLLSAGEHTPSVAFTPSNLSDYAPAEAAVFLTVVRATPEIQWPTPDPIDTATPLGSAQLNAHASVPGTYSYSMAAGERLRPGNYTLSVSFTPADRVNYTRAEASVSLTVTEIVPARVTWLDPHSISYGTALGAEQLNASSPIPGSFIYAPAAGEVLPAGKHKLTVIFTPEDEKKHAKAQANVTLVVEELPNIASLLRASSQPQSDPGVPRDGVAASAADAEVVRGREDQPAPNSDRGIRLYKGALYAKGEDGQWHLQRK